MSDYSQYLYQPDVDPLPEYLEEGVIDTVKSKLGIGRKSRWQEFKDHLKANKGRIAARAAGQIGANLAYSKLSGRSFVDDATGGWGNYGKRMAVNLGGAKLGDRLYKHFTKK